MNDVCVVNIQTHTRKLAYVQSEYRTEFTLLSSSDWDSSNVGILYVRNIFFHQSNQTQKTDDDDDDGDVRRRKKQIPHRHKKKATDLSHTVTSNDYNIRVFSIHPLSVACTRVYVCGVLRTLNLNAFVCSSFGCMSSSVVSSSAPLLIIVSDKLIFVT